MEKIITILVMRFKSKIQFLLRLFIDRRWKHDFGLIILRNRDLSYSCKVRLNNRYWFQRKVFGICYVPDWLRGIENSNDPFYITISRYTKGQTSIYFNVILQTFIDFKKQYKVKGKCYVDIWISNSL